MDLLSKVHDLSNINEYIFSLTITAFVIFNRDDLNKLSPNYEFGMDPLFDIDIEREQSRVQALHPVEVVLEAGELLFVPQGSPHYVENLTLSIAVSGNFVDQTNVRFAAEHFRRNGLTDPRSLDLLEELHHLKFL